MKDNFRNTALKWVIAGCFVLMLILLALHRRVVRVDSFSSTIMGTETHILALAKDEELGQKCVDVARAELEKVDAVMDYHDANSLLSEVNRDAFGRAVKVSGDLFEVISAGVKYGRISGGEFDITIGPMMDLWKNAKHKPSDAEIEAAKAKVGYDKLVLDANNMTVRFSIEGMKIDLGGIAKGYAIDRAIEAMKAAGAAGGLVDLGGNIRCFGVSPGGKGFSVGLQNPKAVADANEPDVLMVFKIDDLSISTSGDYRRFVDVDGERVSHILDPATKHGAKRYSSVTVIAPRAIDADALSTTFSLMDADKAIKLAESLDGVEVLLMDHAGKIVKSSGFEKFIK
jgi:thiamine biosynthesis lipoprotein